MKIGLIDVDGHNFPNLPLMKLSAWHKKRGDDVEWYSPLLSDHKDAVYMSKVFSFTDDYMFYINADIVSKGGTGYAIKVKDGVECYDGSKDMPLNDDVEHIYPDYSIYNVSDTAYGFLSRGCPRGCSFCHVAGKEGLRSRKVADLREFWNGQPEICLCDPNILACKDWRDLFDQLAKSGARVDFNQGLDIRLMTEEKAQMLKNIKIKRVHFAFDRYEDAEEILPRLQTYRKHIDTNPRDVVVYVLCGFDTTFEQDLERIYKIREIGFSPYVMLYDKKRFPPKHNLKRLQRWVNARQAFWSVEKFEDYRR